MGRICSGMQDHKSRGIYKSAGTRGDMRRKRKEDRTVDAWQRPVDRGFSQQNMCCTEILSKFKDKADRFERKRDAKQRRG